MVLCWKMPPATFWTRLKQLWLIIASQFCLRFFQMIDNAYFSESKGNALLIHNIVQSLYNVGLYLGIGVSLSCLIFWKRPECRGKQGCIMVAHLALAFLSASVFAILFILNSNALLDHFQVPLQARGLARAYFKVGAFNVCLLTCYLTLDGLMIGTHQQGLSMFLAIGLCVGKILLNSFFLRRSSICMALSTTGLVLLASAIAVIKVSQKVDGWNLMEFKTMTSVWRSELFSAIIRAGSVVALGYEIAEIPTSPGFIVTFHLLSHLSYLATLPLGSGLQLVLRDMSSNRNGLRSVLYLAALPTLLMFLVELVCPKQCLYSIYGYRVSIEHGGFLRLFLFAGLLTQFSRIPVVMLRAKKNSKAVTRSFLLSEWLVTLGGTQLLIFSGLASPNSFGWILILAAAIFLILVTLEIPMKLRYRPVGYRPQLSP